MVFLAPFGAVIILLLGVGYVTSFIVFGRYASEEEYAVILEAIELATSSHSFKNIMPFLCCPEGFVAVGGIFSLYYHTQADGKSIQFSLWSAPGRAALAKQKYFRVVKPFVDQL